MAAPWVSAAVFRARIIAVNAATSSGSFQPRAAGLTDLTVRWIELGGPAGYSSTNVWSCTGDGTFASPDKITVPAGGSATCTIVNDDIAPQLKLVKVVTNDDGGTAVANDWDLTASGSGGFTELTPAAANATFRDVNAGVSYALSETGPAGYAASSWS